MSSWQQLLLLVGLAGALAGLVWLEIAWVLYPLALLSAFSVIMLLTMVYSMVLVMIFKRENTFNRLRELLIPLISGYVIALIQIGVISVVRFIMTGTWGGFTL